VGSLEKHLSRFHSFVWYNFAHLLV